VNGSTPERAVAQRWFVWGCLFELLLGAMALLVGAFLPITPLATVNWNVRDAALGLAATLPLLALFEWMLNSNASWPKEINAFLENTARPVLSHWSLGQLALVSLCAGIGEELLFRAVIQGGLTLVAGVPFAVVVASCLFGLCHAVTHGYAVIAALIGIYLGLLWVWSGNLLVPIVAHVVYDFAALVYFLRIRSARE
jgi:hypothetical protein